MHALPMRGAAWGRRLPVGSPGGGRGADCPPRVVLPPSKRPARPHAATPECLVWLSQVREAILSGNGSGAAAAPAVAQQLLELRQQAQAQLVSV
jgi:hypothetical protein